MKDKKDIVGQKFNRLLVLSIFGKDKKSRKIIQCKCDCGTIFNVSEYSVKNGFTKSCGCLTKEKASITHKKHGITHSRFYNVWCGIKDRCLNEKNEHHKDYGGRGITVCDRWLDNFLNFKEDMYESYLEHVKEHGEKQTTIDRTNNNLGYTKENCRWATYKEQNNNRRDKKTQLNFIAIDTNGIIYKSNNQTAFSQENNLKVGSVNRCLKGLRKTHRGWRFQYA